MVLTIKPIGHQQLAQVLVLLNRYASQEYETLQRFRQLTIPFLRLSYYLPPKHQRAPGLFVACRQRQVLGVVVLTPDGANGARWQVEQLIVDPDESAFDVGSQLLNYVVNRYGAEGVAHFVAHIGHQDVSEGGALLKASGFRPCSQLHYLELPGNGLAHWATHPPELTECHHLQEACKADAAPISQCVNDAMPPEVRISLGSEPADFMRAKRKGLFFRRWVVMHTARQVAMGVVELTRLSEEHIHLWVALGPGWVQQTGPVLDTVLSWIARMNRSCRISLTVADYDPTLTTEAQQRGFILTGSAAVLVKDYWVPLRPSPLQRLKTPVVLRHISPA
jgi:GNAT superfamily N-acetyltransferase